MNAFKKFVSGHAKLFQSGKRLSPPHFKNSARKNQPTETPRALVFSPHPDDECIVGAFPLRLLREANWRIVNVAVTLGSKRERKAGRLRELKNACDFLGFDLVVAGENGLEKINLAARKENRRLWNANVRAISEILAAQKPRVIFLPHAADVHPTHVGAHFLVLDALKRLPRGFECFVVETEFWGQMANPNLLVESGVETVADLVAALSLHAGEVKRNPYHARLPAWLMDNVRRGAELVGRRGAAAPDFIFGTIYRVQKWRAGTLKKCFSGEKFLGAKQNPAALFR